MKIIFVIVVALGLVSEVFGEELASIVELNPDISDYGSEDRIIGGYLAANHSRPWMVTLRGMKDAFFFCGGVLVHPQWVLTAAHCVYSRHYTLVAMAGSNQRCEIIHGELEKNLGEGAIEINVASVYPSKYDNVTLKNDIALLKLVSPFPISENITVASLPPIKDLQEGDMLEISGWGQYDRAEPWLKECYLRTVSLPVEDLQECKDSFEADIDESHLCAGYEYGNKTACEGDSGGPLVKMNGKAATVHGIYSFSSQECDRYAVFTKVSYYSKWINDTMKL